MANQIALEFATRGDAAAAAATADHLRRFWDPAMKTKILNCLRKPNHGLGPTAAAAVRLLQAGTGAAK